MLTIRGHIGLKGMREILRHPKLLGKVPFLLETPKHLPQHRTIRRRSAAIQRLDEKLSRLERDCLIELLAFSDHEWQNTEKRQEWWTAGQRRERDVKRKIGKLVCASRQMWGGDDWKDKSRFRRLCKKDNIIRRIGSRRYSRRKMHST